MIFRTPSPVKHTSIIILYRQKRTNLPPPHSPSWISSLEAEAGRHDVVELSMKMLAVINGKLDFLVTTEASLTEAEHNKRNEFSLSERLNAALTLQETLS